MLLSVKEQLSLKSEHFGLTYLTNTFHFFTLRQPFVSNLAQPR